MKYYLSILIITLTAILFLGGACFSTGLSSAALAQPQLAEKAWTGKTYNGNVITSEDLARILANHKKWLTTNKEEGERAYLGGADLSGAYLSRADLRSAYLDKANLESADLSQADLGRAELREAKLSGADLSWANLSLSQLYRADLSKATLKWGKLGATHLIGASLLETDLRWADMSKTDLREAKLNGANLKGANLIGDLFEPLPESLPAVDSIANAEGLSGLWYESSPQSLVKLRKAFKEAGYRQQEREITCSLKRSDTWQNWRIGGVARIKAAFNYIFFDLTCNYGISPWRPLTLLALCVLIFFPFYCLALRSPRSDTGIWVSWLPDRVLKGEGQEKPMKLTNIPPFRPADNGKLASSWWHLRRLLRVLRLGLYFSLVSAFSLGWRELNVGNWISRIQKREYTLRPTGWVRTLAGIQSLLSAFLLALWAFLYVGSIFE